MLALVVIFLLVAALISTEAARMSYQREAHEYAALLSTERAKVRKCVNRRLAALENRMTTLPEKEVNNAYQARLAVVRRRFVVGMRWPDAPVCPVAAPVPMQAPEPTTGADAPVCAMSEAEAVNARATAQKLAALQAWVRENMEDKP